MNTRCGMNKAETKWEPRKADVNSAHQLKCVHTYSMSVKWSENELDISEVWYPGRPRDLLFTLGYYEVAIGNIFWPRPCNRKHVHPAQSDPDHRFNTDDTHTHTAHILYTHMQARLSQALTAGQCLKEGGRKSLQSEWANELTHWCYLFSLGVSVRLNVLCSAMKRNRGKANE